MSVEGVPDASIPVPGNRARIFKLLRSPRIDSKEPIPPDCVCSLAGRYDNPIPTRFLAPIDSLKIPAQILGGGGGVAYVLWVGTRYSF